MIDTTNPHLLTADRLLEEAADSASYCDDGATANAILDRGKRAADALALLPEGWTVERYEYESSVLRGSETEFRVLDEDGERVHALTRRHMRREAVHVVTLGTSTQFVESAEARGRAVLLLLAACDAESYG